TSAWSAPILFVRKHDGSLRMCLDYRGLNACTQRDRYPIPRIDDLLDTLGNHKDYSKLDLANGYWQGRVQEGDCQKLAFSIPGMGHYEFVVMPFGVVNAPSVFMRLMHNVLRGL